MLISAIVKENSKALLEASTVKLSILAANNADIDLILMDTNAWVEWI
jgi:hypothetical protein